MNLSEYIRQVGEEAFAKAVKCSVRAARAYRYKQRTPREVALIKRIVSRTPVTHAGIMGLEP